MRKQMAQSGSTGVERKTIPWYHIPALEVFPASLSIIHLAGLEEQFSPDTIFRLKEIEDDLNKNAKIASILLAPTKDDLDVALEKAYEVAIDYYVESGIIIWRSPGHDYTKLLNLAQVSCQIIENMFFKKVKRLELSTFTRSVAGLRVLREVGRRVTLSEEQTSLEKQAPPLKYLTRVILSTFILSCLLAYVQHQVKKVQPANLEILSDELFSITKETYEEALDHRLFVSEAEIIFWNPEWQQGEVEVDLDKLSGGIKAFNNINDLIRCISFSISNTKFH
jgi:hypothetical protein